MFQNCISLPNLPDISKWKDDNRSFNINNTFRECLSLLSKPKEFLIDNEQKNE